MQFDDRVYQHIVGIPMGTNAHKRFALILLREDLMSNLHKSKMIDLGDMFNYTS